MTETNRAVAALGESKLLQAGVADVNKVRDRTRRRRLLRAIVVIGSLDAFLWYRSRGDEGFTQGQRIAVAHDERKGPAIVFASSSEIILTADMSGDGLSDLVRVRNEIGRAHV